MPSTYPGPVEIVPDKVDVKRPARPVSRLRRLTAAAVAAAALLVAVVVGAGWWVRDQVEATIAARIDHRIPGSAASVDISSFPFLARLAATGTIDRMSAHLKRVSAGPFTYNGIHVAAATFADVDIRVDGLRLRRRDLPQRKVVIAGIRQATITATLDQDSLDRSVGLPVTLGRGSVGLGGLSLPAQITVAARQVTVTVPGQLAFSLTLPPLAVFPCQGRVIVESRALQISCRADRLPPVLAGTEFSF